MSLARAGRTKTSRVILLWVLVIGSGAVIVGGVLANFLLTRPPLPEPCTTEALAPRSTPTPLVSFGVVSVEHGNATITIVRATFCPAPSEYRFSIGFKASSAVGMFASSGSYTTTVASNTTFRVTWMDEEGQGLVNVGDTFRVTGDGRPLPSGEQFTLYLYMTNMTLVAAANWWT